MKKRVLSLLLALALLLTALPRLSLPAGAADPYSGSCGNNLTWRFDPDTGTLSISGSGAMKEYNIEAAPWYSYRSAIVALDLPEGLTKIGDYAFYQCNNLTSLIFPDSLSEIGILSFSGCSALHELAFPDDLKLIDHGAFQDCVGLTSLLLPDGISVIEQNAFACCSGLSFLKLPAHITVIQNAAFMQCSGLTALTLPDSLVEIGPAAFLGCIGLSSLTLPQGITEIENMAFEHCTGLRSVTFPDKLTKIADFAFAQCTGLTSLSFPDSLTEIGSAAFCECTALSSLFLPGSIRELGRQCFQGCTSLQAVVMGEGVPYLSSCMFAGCTALESVEFSGGLTEIQEQAFLRCDSLREAALPEGLTTLGDSAFSNCCKLEQLYLPASLRSVGSFAFSSCYRLQEAWIPDGVTSVGEGAFAGCFDLRHVKLPAGLTVIPSRMFNFCYDLDSITLPDGLNIIGPAAFSVTGLRSVTIPASVLKIDEDAFRSCGNLNALIFQNNSCLICGQTAELEDSAETPQWQERPNTLGSRSKTWLYVRQSEQPSAGGAARELKRQYRFLTQYAAEYGYHLCPLDSFRDVSPSAYYAVPVAWAVENGITTGAGNGSFRPKQVCTREQVVTFLWKAAGSPKPVSSQNPFSDVKPGKYYYSAVLWAVEKGITSGATTASFGVGKPCTREQVVSFLWKALGSPAPEGTESPFTDVKPGKYYFSPVLWAVEHGVTSGATPTTFGVGRPCTRAQVVTFLYNAYVLNG